MSGFAGCPGSRTVEFKKGDSQEVDAARVPSQLRQWPIQLHLVSPQAPYFQGADVVLAADCVPFAVPLGTVRGVKMIAVGVPRVIFVEAVQRDQAGLLLR